MLAGEAGDEYWISDYTIWIGYGYICMNIEYKDIMILEYGWNMKMWILNEDITMDIEWWGNIMILEYGWNMEMWILNVDITMDI